MPARFRLILVFVFILSAAALPALHFARWSTSMGSFTAHIYDQETPITSSNFIQLANSGFYNNLIFHRVVAGFVIQDGCPLGTGYGGPGWTIPLEIYPGFHHDQAGMLAMARSSNPNSAGSQYYFTLAPAPHLDGNYAIFGKVVEGLDVVLAIGSVPVDNNDRPLTPVTIDTLRMLDLSIASLTPPDSDTVHANSGESLMFVVEAYSQNHVVNYLWLVDGVVQEGSQDFLFECAFSGTGEHSVECVVSNPEWSHTIHWDVYAESTGVDEQVLSPDLRLVASPNPAKNGITLKLRAGQSPLSQVSVYNIKGRLLRSVDLRAKSSQEWFWDGTDQQRRRVAPGVYLLKAETRQGTLWRKCVLH